MNKERHERKAYWLVIETQFLTGGDTKGLYPTLPLYLSKGWKRSGLWFFILSKS
jgi:hypothetical protein